MTDNDTFLFFALRDAGYQEQDISPYIKEQAEAFYSLNRGLDFYGKYTNDQTLDEFCQSNLSTRRDSFFTVGIYNALLVESLWKRENFTKQRVTKEKQQVSEENIAIREHYNDLNYLIWLEILLYQRQMVNYSCQSLNEFYRYPIAKQSVYELLTFQEKMRVLISNLQGSMTTKFETYQSWVDRGREVMGINARYEVFNERIESIYDSIQTKYDYEQIHKQNSLNQLGIRLSLVAAVFCVIEFLAAMSENFKEQKMFLDILKYDWLMYPISIVVIIGLAVGFFVRSNKEKE